MKINGKFLLALIILSVVIVAYSVSKYAGKKESESSGSGLAGLSTDEIVQKFFDTKSSDPSAYDEGAVYLDYLSRPLRDKLSETKASGVAYDPVLCAEDLPTAVRVETVNSNETTANYIVTETFIDGGDTKVAVKVQKTGSRWIIDDINCFAPKPKITSSQ